MTSYSLKKFKFQTYTANINTFDLLSPIIYYILIIVKMLYLYYYIYLLLFIMTCKRYKKGLIFKT